MHNNGSFTESYVSDYKSFLTCDDWDDEKFRKNLELISNQTG